MSGRLFTPLARENMAVDTRNMFSSLKPVCAFQTLRLATLGKWATTHRRVFFLGQELLLDFAAWIDLTGLCCYTEGWGGKCSEILATIKLLYNPRVNNKYSIHFKRR